MMRIPRLFIQRGIRIMRRYSPYLALCVALGWNANLLVERSTFAGFREDLSGTEFRSFAELGDQKSLTLGKSPTDTFWLLPRYRFLVPFIDYTPVTDPFRSFAVYGG